MLLETALAIPMLMMVAVALAWGLSLAATSAALGDTARTAARALARGEAPSDVLARAMTDMPSAIASLDDQGPDVAVLVSEDVSAPVPLLRGLSVTISQRVVVPREWT